MNIKKKPIPPGPFLFPKGKIVLCIIHKINQWQDFTIANLVTLLTYNIWWFTMGNNGNKYMGQNLT